MYNYSFNVCSVEKSKVGNNFIISLSISIDENNLAGVDSFNEFSFLLSLVCIMLSFSNLINNNKTLIN